MEAALQQARKGYVKQVNDAVSVFHMAYWEHLCRTQPNLLMARPTPKGSRGTWIMLSVKGWSSKVHLNHKLARGSVELSFERRTREDLLALNIEWTEGVLPVSTGNYGSLAITVPVIDVRQSFESQQEAVESAFAAMQCLVPFGEIVERLPVR
jgi:hypothetical protein